MAKKNGEVSTNFAILVMVFLILSTVIIFAVLLFLSFENTVNNFMSTKKKDVTNACASFSRELSENAESDDEMFSYATSYQTSYMLTFEGNIYITDESGQIIYRSESGSNNRLATNSDVTFITDAEVLELINSAYNGGNSTVVNINDGSSGKDVIVASSKILNTNYVLTLSSEFSKSEAEDSFITIMFYPALISLIIAVLLYVLLASMTLGPIRDISRVITKVSQGDLTARVDKKYLDENEMSNVSLTNDIMIMAKTVNSMIDTLENQENDRSIFISSVAHDIRTPLTSINGFITAMLDGTIPNDQYDRYLIMIKDEVNRIRKLVVSMTEASSLSHIDPDVMEKFELEDVVNDIIQNLEPQLSEKSITVKKVFDADMAAKIAFGESQQLCRVIVNIITNAIKFTPIDGTIRVSTKADIEANNIKVIIEDSGPGVPPDKRSRVFESFYKVDSSRKQEGFGLGLYICKQILTGHGQSIYLDGSEDFGGAKFVMTLPMPPKEG